MSKQKQAIDFGKLVAELQDPGRQWGKDQLAIWGGWCRSADVLTLLQDWPQRDETMPYRTWEYADQITIEEKTLPSNSERLERGRLFGPGGDLTVRRDGDRFRWHFVGKPDVQLPTGDFHAESFWAQPGEDQTEFYQREEQALLWGERPANFDLWFEDRTGQAKLKYPVAQPGRVRVKYQLFSRDGQVQFVWLLGLEACDE